MFLTRKQHDQLIDKHPEFMKKEWLKLKRAWSLGGVKVSGSKSQLEKLENLLK